MRIGWPRQREPDPIEEEFAEQRRQTQQALTRGEQVLERAAEVLPDDAMTEIRRTEHAAGREHG